ncbi:MAG: hypothetical protein MnENMB40S_01260 [Rhizobiaceae bacterium MnEN-MB40S]|nr:MAG: hypothetical protein MnENMB40S_01260 [Rhizobiaceae bacterium MnEN-MB40S]
MGVFLSYWRGERALGPSFWLFFVAPCVIVYAALAGVMTLHHVPFVVFVCLLVASLLIFATLSIGVIRAGEAHVAARGSLAPVWGSYVAIIVVLFIFGAQWLGLYQRTIWKPEEELFTTKMDRLHASTYDLSLSDDGRVLTLDGDVALGSTKIIRTLLSENSSVKALALNSKGGNIYEARGIARLVSEGHLDTRIDGECSSACTIIFISGANRTMGADAKLGFHQYRLDSTANIPNVDIAEEQSRDRAFFENQAIDPEFLKRIFNSPHNAIWYPERSELETAGVITTPD